MFAEHRKLQRDRFVLPIVCRFFRVTEIMSQSFCFPCAGITWLRMSMWVCLFWCNQWDVLSFSCGASVTHGRQNVLKSAPDVPRTYVCVCTCTAEYAFIWEILFSALTSVRPREQFRVLCFFLINWVAAVIMLSKLYILYVKAVSYEQHSRLSDHIQTNLIRARLSCQEEEERAATWELGKTIFNQDTAVWDKITRCFLRRRQES